MSKLTFRVVFSVLISLGVIFAIFTTVQSASFDSAAERVGSHAVSGLMTNFNHDRLTVTEQEAYRSELDSFNKSSSSPGHGCDDQAASSPID